MNGKLILIPLKEPKEGMKVVYRDDKGKFWTKPITLITYPRNSDIPQYTVHFPPSFPECRNYFSLYELQQIAVEYKKDIRSADSFDLSVYSSTETLLLHPDDYEKALPLIGKEVEFDKQSLDMGKQTERIEAKLITPTPVMYTDKEVELLITEASNFTMRNIIDKNRFSIGGWWNENKKK